MKILLAENDKYRVFQTSKRRMVAESKTGFQFFRAKFYTREEGMAFFAEMLLKTFLCPDKTEDAPAPDA